MIIGWKSLKQHILHVRWKNLLIVYNILLMQKCNRNLEIFHFSIWSAGYEHGETMPGYLLLKNNWFCHPCLQDYFPILGHLGMHQTTAEQEKFTIVLLSWKEPQKWGNIFFIHMTSKWWVKNERMKPLI